MPAVYVSLPHLAAKMARLPEHVGRATVRGIREGVRDAVPLMRRRTVRAKPASPGGLVGATATLRYLYNWRTGELSDGAVLYNDQPYASTIELGQGPGRAPPTANLVRWLSYRFGYDSTNPRTWVIARGIALSIARRGLLPRRVMIEAVDQVADLVGQRVAREITRELEQL